MDKQKGIAIFVVVILVVAAVGVVWFTQAKDDGPTYAEVTDAVGNKIKLSDAPERIATTTVVATEMICDLGYRDRFVGASSDAGIYDVESKVYGVDLDLDYPGTIKQDMESGKIKAVGQFYKWTAESVLACKPDFVVMEEIQVEKDPSQMDQIKSLGVTVFVLWSDSTWEMIKKGYTALGDALGKQDRAKHICDCIDKGDMAVKDKVGSAKPLNVAHICYCFGSYYIYNLSSPMMVIEALGSKNALPTTQSFVTITPETIAAAKIDLIIFDDMATSLDWSEVIAQWKADPIMGNVDAIKNDRFYCLEYGPFKATSYKTVHFLEGEALVAAMLYGDAIGVNVPQILKDDGWRDSVAWLDKAVA